MSEAAPSAGEAATDAAQPLRNRWLHRFAFLLACCVLGLISAGALVTSKEAGLSVPDWPLSYGGFNPPRWWQIENVRAEHGHRLIAGTVAMMTVLLAVWIQRKETRRWVKRLAWLAVAAVLTQALLGGMTVLFFLPTAISVSHAGLAEIFFLMTVSLAVVTSRFWRRAAGRPVEGELFPRLATATTVVIYLQILVGAVMRHSGAGLAIPDFPLAFGRLIPPAFDFGIAVHFAHRIGALVVLALVVSTARCVLSKGAARHSLPRGAAIAMLALVAVQVTLGATVVLSGKAVLPNTLHVATGASLLATSLLLTLSSRRLAHETRRAHQARPDLSLEPHAA